MVDKDKQVKKQVDEGFDNLVDYNLSGRFQEFIKDLMENNVVYSHGEFEHIENLKKKINPPGKCSKCGFFNDPGDKVCFNCGGELVPGTPSSKE